MSTLSSSNLLENTCPACRQLIPLDSPAGTCPTCALKEALELGQEKVRNHASPQTQPERTGRRFGDYELLDQLGRGGMGVVYRAYQTPLKRIVALKMILDGKHSAQAARRFQIEAEAAARLLHPNIVRLYEFGFEDEQPFFTMECIEGESLSRRISRGDYGVLSSQNPSDTSQRINRAVELIATLALAVQYAHERGVIHRDIKPGNILIDGEGRPHLTDFGLAKLSKESTTIVSESGSVAGTPAYMAPEQARGDSLSFAADIYSLGVVLFEVLTGKPPFVATTPLETLRLITDQEPPNLTRATKGRIDADLATICRKCLEKQPGSRYGSAQELSDDLSRWIRREPIRARPIGRLARVHRWTRRNPIGASFIALLLLGLITTTALVQRVRDGSRIVEEQYDRVHRSLMARIEDFWERPEVITLPIPSEEIAVLLKLPGDRQKISGAPRRLRVSQTVPDSPMNQIVRKGYGLAQLEDRLSVLLKRPVLIDLMLFKPRGGKTESLIRGDSQLKRMGALPYLVAKSLKPGLTPLAVDSEAKQAAIFVRKDSGITNLSQLHGKSLAFGDEDATISFQAKAELARAGILGSHLSKWEHLRRQHVATNLSDSSLQVFRASSHARAIIAVRKGAFDVGVGRLEYVRDFTKRELRIIHQFQSTPNFWVGSDELSAEEVRAIRQALTEKPLQIAGGPDTSLERTKFLPMDQSYFDIIRMLMTNEVARFEGDRPVQSRFPTLIEQQEDDE